MSSTGRIRLKEVVRSQGYRHVPIPILSNVRIGVDVAHIPRFEALLSGPGSHLSRWVTRNLHFREEIFLWQRLSNWEKQAPANRKKSLARYLAGRWALKEATIKAYAQRRLYPNDVAILQSRKQAKPEVVIAPPPELVLFTDAYARRYGLAGTENPAKATTSPEEPAAFASLTSDAIEEHASQPEPATAEPDAIANGSTDPSVAAAARVRVPDLSMYQAADGSVSHDGEYAFAVVQVPAAAPETNGDPSTNTSAQDRQEAAVAGGYASWSPKSLLSAARAALARGAEIDVDVPRGPASRAPPWLSLPGDRGCTAMRRTTPLLAEWLDGASVADLRCKFPDDEHTGSD